MERETAQTPTNPSTTSQATSQVPGQAGQSFRREGEARRSDDNLDVTERAREALEEGAEGISNTAHRVAERTREVASNVMSRASELGSRVVEGTDRAMSVAGTRIENLGQTLRERAPEEGTVGKVIGRTGHALAQSGQYLQESTPTDVRMDLEDVMRRRPLTTLLVGAGMGFLIARMLRRRD